VGVYRALHIKLERYSRALDLHNNIARAYSTTDCARFTEEILNKDNKHGRIPYESIFYESATRRYYVIRNIL